MKGGQVQQERTPLGQALEFAQMETEIPHELLEAARAELSALRLYALKSVRFVEVS